MNHLSVGNHDEEDEDDEIYRVDCILAEKLENGKTKYLIKWQDYEEEESTWEPRSNITAGGDLILQRWAEDQKRVRNGYLDAFDIEDFERRVEAYRNRGVAASVGRKNKALSKISPRRKTRSMAARQGVTNQLFVESDEDDTAPTATKPKPTDSRSITPKPIGTGTPTERRQAQQQPNDLNSRTSKLVDPNAPIKERQSEEQLKKVTSATTAPIEPKAQPKERQAQKKPRGSTPKKSKSVKQGAPIKERKVQEEVVLDAEEKSENQAQADSQDSGDSKADPAPSKKRKDTPASLVEPPAKRNKTSTNTATRKAATGDSTARAPSTPNTAASGKAPATVSRAPRPSPFNDQVIESSSTTSTLGDNQPAMQSAQKSKPNAAAKIFGDDDPAKIRTRKHSENGKFYSPSHIQNIMKRNRDGVAPDPRTLNLQTPSEMAGANNRSKTPTDSTIPRTLATPLNHQPPARLEVSPYAQSIPLVCHYVHEGRICPEGEHQCRFLHRKDYEKEVASPTLHQQAINYKTEPERWPKFTSPVIVCAFQYQNHDGCFRGHDCVYAHWKPLRGEWRYHIKKKVCAYWARGHCRNFEDCPFAHERLDEAAPLPDIARARLTCPFWYDHHYEGSGKPCTKGDSCSFAHELLAYIARNPREGIGLRQTDPALLQAAQRRDTLSSHDSVAQQTPFDVQHEALQQQDTQIPDIPTAQRDIPASLLVNQQPTAIAIIQQPPQQASRSTSPQTADCEARVSIEGPLNVIDDLNSGQKATIVLPASAIDNAGTTLPATDDLEVDSQENSNMDSAAIAPPEIFTLTVDLLNLEMDVRLPLAPEIVQGLEEYFDGGARRVAAAATLRDDLIEYTNKDFSDIRAAGWLVASGVEVELAELADNLAHENSALVLGLNNVVIVLFPSRGDVENDDEPLPPSTIGFEVRMRPPDDHDSNLSDDEFGDDIIIQLDTFPDQNDDNGLLPDIEDDEDDPIHSSIASNLIERSFGIPYEDLFRWPTNPHTVKRDIFLLIDDDREAEVGALSSILQWAGASTYIPEEEGSWEVFRGNGEGVVILDERFPHYRDIPYLSHLLWGRYNFFELELSTTKPRFKQLFKTGQTILLTDRALQEEPAAIVVIVKYVKERNKNKLPGSESRRIFARPGVSDWLLQVAQEDAGAEGPNHEAHTALWNELNMLNPDGTPQNELEFTNCVLFEPFWVTLNGEEVESKDWGASTAMKTLLSAFDTTFCQYREMSRNWVVIHASSEAEEAQKWAETYQNMSFMTADKFKLKVMRR